ncbi:MAG: S8 family peptidase [Romboutsia sp.]
MKYKQEDLTVKLIPFTLNREVKSKDVKAPYGVDMIKAKSIWEESQRGKDVKIAVIDSGCDVNHESLKDNIIGVKNFTDEDGKNSQIVTDRVGHGTHVIGIIAANGNNNTIVGVAPDSKIYVLKAIDKTGSGKLSWVVNAIYYAIEQNVDIISMSLGMSQSSEKLERAVKEATNKNILVVCAAGNDGDGNSNDFEYSYPASYVDVISVGAIDKKGVPASFSNSNLVIDVVAPGVNILSTYPHNQFAILSGTSMATPHVSGSLALLKNWSEKEFQRILTQNELYAQLIKHTRVLNYSRTVQGNGLVYLENEKGKKKIKY